MLSCANKNNKKRAEENDFFSLSVFKYTYTTNNRIYTKRRQKEETPKDQGKTLRKTCHKEINL